MFDHLPRVDIEVGAAEGGGQTGLGEAGGDGEAGATSDGSRLYSVAQCGEGGNVLAPVPMTAGLLQIERQVEGGEVYQGVEAIPRIFIRAQRHGHHLDLRDHDPHHERQN